MEGSVVQCMKSAEKEEFPPKKRGRGLASSTISLKYDTGIHPTFICIS